MKKTKIISIILSMAAICGACSSCGDKETASGDGKYDKKLTYTMTAYHSDSQIEESASWQYIKEKFNIDAEFYYVSEADASEKARIWMATGDMPDVMLTSIGTNYNTFVSWVNQGLVREIPDLSKWENLKEQQDNIAVSPYFTIDGKRYAWVSGNKYDPERPHGNPAPYGFLYRKDMAQELGLYNENDEYTWEEFLELAKAMRDKYSSDGGFIPWGMDAGLYPYGTGLMMYSPYWEQYRLNENGKYEWAMDAPETLESIKAANRMFKDGIFSSDQAIFNGSEASDKFKTGKCGILMSNCSTYVLLDIFTQFEATQSKSADDCISIARVYAPDGKMWGQYGMNYSSITIYRPDMSDEKMERLMDIYDWVLSDEGIEMIQYGVEGVDHTVVDGKKVLVNEDGSITGACPFFAKNLVAGAPAVPEIQEKLYGENIMNLYNEYIDFLVAHDENFRKYDFNQVFFGGERYRQHGAYFYDGSDLIKRLMPSEKSEAEIENEFNKWKDSVRPNVEAVLAELNAE
ncbi:MAG: extracellular solute-binding protein [Clostridia bacterium]|nr:extracellular solute-binding protein [Clostridia bacterium]